MKSWGPVVPAALSAIWLSISCSPERESVKPQPKPAVETATDYRKLLESLPDPQASELTKEQASQFAALSLKCADQEYPNKSGHVSNSDESLKPPRKMHPAFFGCFDWHSAVHGHWAMVRLLKKFPDISSASEIRATLERHLTEENIEAELECFKEDALFERPYGWGWFLRLKAELQTFDDPDAQRWSKALDPLAAHISELARSYLETLSAPVREGTHQSTAFALIHIHDYATIAGDAELKEVVERRSRDFFGGDVDCPCDYEPSGEDFLSPCLTEADLMGRIMQKQEFAEWLDKLLGPLDSPRFEKLLRPIEVKDRKDPKIGHLIGLFFQRAASYKSISRILPQGDPRTEVFARLSAIHRQAGLDQMRDSGYGGEHWLASFAIYLLTDAESGPVTRFPAAPRIVAIGDLHGDFEVTRAVLRLAGATDENDRWIGKDLVVVQTGDAVDRGDGEREIQDLFARLKIEARNAGGAFRPLVGNHELMNIGGNLRYVSAKAMSAFDFLVPGFQTLPAVGRFPPAHRGRAAAFMPGGPVARTIAGRNVATIVGDTVFVHAGILPKHAEYGLERINRETRDYIRGDAPSLPPIMIGQDSPVWTRLYSLEEQPNPQTCETLENTLKMLNAARMVVGHTVQNKGITSACDNKVFRIDTGMSAAYVGSDPYALEIIGDKITPLKGVR